MQVKYTSRIPEVLSRIEKAKIIGLTECALIVQKDATMNCAVDTGRLRASISYSVDGGQVVRGTGSVVATKTNPHPSQGINDTKIEGKPMHAVIGTNVVYAKGIEINGGKNGVGRAFLSNALNNNIQVCINRCRKAIQKACEL